ncbi:MAG TPA: hypothetical protein VGE38_07470 [Nocardioides sp.]|uniref:hypothetical protein n=1 Tax=Nocardioides sp. TaxID=35761 RepID=UPI002ED805FB
MTVVNTETGEIVEVHPEEPAAVAMLSQAITALTTALDEMPISEIATTKAKVATVATATKELGMSREAQELAAEAVRRAEWALGRAIRKGQSEGEIAKQGPAPDFSLGEVKRVTDYGTTGELYARDGKPGILTLADEIPEAAAFDAAIDAAKAEGNLSRANVARKAREAAGQAVRTPPRKPLPDAFFNAAYDLTKVVERIDRLVEDDRFPQNAEKVGAKHRVDLLRAVELLSKALDRLA